MLIMVLLPASLLCSSQEKDKKSVKVVDDGSFGIFMNGKRIATETFHIEQHSDMGVATSEIKVTEDGVLKADQSSEMQIASNGDLRLYSWHATVPEKEQSVVEPKD